MQAHTHFPDLRARERAFGQSFADVQVFYGPVAEAAALEIGARAFTHENKIAFAETAPSKELVGHELTHVVQQRGGTSKGVQPKSLISSSGDAHEVEADRVGASVASGGKAEVRATPEAAISRSGWDIAAAVVLQGNAPFARAAVTEAAKANQLTKDIFASIGQAPGHGATVWGPLREDIKHHWPEIVQQLATLMAIEVTITALVAVPDPSFGTKFVALVLQTLVLAVAAIAAYDSIKSAFNAGLVWWNLIKEAHGNPYTINNAAALFAKLVLDVVQAMIATGGLIATAGLGFRVPGREVERIPAGVASKDAKPKNPSARTAPDTEKPTTTATSERAPEDTKPRSPGAREPHEIARQPVTVHGETHTLKLIEKPDGSVDMWMCSDCGMFREKIDASIRAAPTKGPGKALRSRLEVLREKVVDIEQRLKEGTLKYDKSPGELAQIAMHLADLSKKYKAVAGADSLCFFCVIEMGIDHEALAESMGFSKVGGRSHGEAVYRKGNTYISADHDSHLEAKGAVWKKATGEGNLAKKATRDGTYNVDLTIRIAP